MAIRMPKRTDDGEWISETSFEGCVFATRERNGYSDSDFYAIVWDRDAGKVREITYDSTRFAGGGSATVDATDEVRREAAAWLFPQWVAALRAEEDLEAARVRPGRRVTVARGRKVPIGTEAVVGYLEDRTYGYNNTVTGATLDTLPDADGNRTRHYNVNVANLDVADDMPRASDSEIRRRAYAAAMRLNRNFPSYVRAMSRSGWIVM